MLAYPVFKKRKKKVVSTCVMVLVKKTQNSCSKAEGWRLTFTRSLFSERNTLRFLNPWSSCMSSGSNRVFSKHLDTSPDLPFWGSLRDASDVMGSPELSTKAGFHMVALEHCSLSVLLPAPIAVPFFYWALVTLSFFASGCCVGWSISPSSEPSVGFPLFLFFLGASATEVWVGVGVGSRGTMGTTGDGSVTPSMSSE